MVQIDRRPSYLSAKILARELDISESQLYLRVRGGVLPKPIKLSSDCARWPWDKVQAALSALEDKDREEAEDPFMQAYGGTSQNLTEPDICSSIAKGCGFAERVGRAKRKGRR